MLIVFLYKFLKNTNNIIGDDMEKKIYDKLVYNHRPQEKRGQNAVIAFLIGGITGVIGELLVEFYGYYLDISGADASIFMIITLIFFASLFTALGFFDKAFKLMVPMVPETETSSETENTPTENTERNPFQYNLSSFLNKHAFKGGDATDAEKQMWYTSEDR